jgi:hypothetical protein
MSCANARPGQARNGELSNITAEAPLTWRPEGFAPGIGAHHGFYYAYLQPGRTMFDHWLEYNGEAAGQCRSPPAPVSRSLPERKADRGNRD